jgi:hypothetical protein
MDCCEYAAAAAAAAGDESWVFEMDLCLEGSKKAVP